MDVMTYDYTNQALELVHSIEIVALVNGSGTDIPADARFGLIWIRV